MTISNLKFWKSEESTDQNPSDKTIGGEIDQWRVIYIAGNGKFKTELLTKLQGESLPFLPGYQDPGLTAKSQELIWIPETSELRLFKRAIGAKLIWKYRLRFYESIDDLLLAEESGALHPMEYFWQ